MITLSWGFLSQLSVKFTRSGGAGQQNAPLTMVRKILLDHIHYEELVQASLKHVMRDALKLVEKQGLPGKHHFYITFRTDHPDVSMPDYLKDKNPEEMTIVVQHQFWNLSTDAHGFRVTLSFNNIQEELGVPFDAISHFLDPSANFGLQFTPVLTSNKQPVTAEVPENSGEGAKVILLDSFRKK